jgi:hypothetical protein
MYSTGAALTATRWAASWWRTVAGRPLELGRGLGDVETRTEPELKHLAVEAGGDACTQAAEVAGAEHDVGEPGENVVAAEAKASRPGRRCGRRTRSLRVGHDVGVRCGGN